MCWNWAVMVLWVSYKYNSRWIYSRSDLVFLRDFIWSFWVLFVPFWNSLMRSGHFLLGVYCTWHLLRDQCQYISLEWFISSDVISVQEVGCLFHCFLVTFCMSHVCIYSARLWNKISSVRAQLLGLCSSLEFVVVFSSVFFASPCLTYPKEPVYHLGHTKLRWKSGAGNYKIIIIASSTQCLTLKPLISCKAVEKAYMQVQVLTTNTHSYLALHLQGQTWLTLSAEWAFRMINKNFTVCQFNLSADRRETQGGLQY